MNRFNAEAGETPEPVDPIAIAVAEESARLVWRALPYFEARFGQRGRRFGLSDAGWLATLVALPASARMAQIDWLAGLLSPRGIPSWTIEVQLEAMARAGERRSWSGVPAIRDEVRRLAARRRGLLTDGDFAECGRRFALSAGETLGARTTGKLVASAVLDVPLGHAASAAATLGWLRDWKSARGGLASAVDAVLDFISQVMRQP